VSGIGFTHTLFVKTAAAETSVPTVVFVEGDGLPWRNRGWQPNPDPRPVHALAFNLFLKTPGPAWYITRPCYDDSLTTSACNSLVWTDARYSAANISSMAAALHRFAAEQQAQKLLLVGYSGGGALAVLIAAQLPEVAGVVTIAANLDQAAWAESHHYSPLIGSLNPATDTENLTMPHLALHGRRDDNVPISTLSGFITTHPATRWQYIDDYDHVCCWERDWPMLWPTLLQTFLEETH
jgi:pimeloyl-ACP methyl ester carboxylesterase